MRRLLGIVVLTFLISIIATFTHQPGASAQGITVIINGDQQQYGQPPILQNGRTLVPLRGIFESLGAIVVWDQQGKKVTSIKGQNKVELIIGSNQAWLNGNSYILDVPAKIVSGRTLVPLRFVGEAQGAEVDWNNLNKTVHIRNNYPEQQRISAPIGIQAIVFNDQISLSWGIEQGIDYYHVYFSDSYYGYYASFTRNGNKAQFTNKLIDYKAKAGELWYYKVTAVKNGVESNYSEVVSAVLPIVTGPSELKLIADNYEKTFLGKLNTNEYDLDSVFNEYGKYGSPYRSFSIWNEFGRYGSSFGTYSAFNQFSSSPPMIVDSEGKIVGRVTTNSNTLDGIHPDQLFEILVRLGY